MPSELKVNKLSPYTGSTLTIGDSGDTISFASGVLPSLESLTITGDLTVDTDTLYVDSTNNRVGVGTASPTSPLTVSTSSGAVGLKVISTSAGTLGPDLSLQHDSASPADNDIISLISFQGNDSGGTNTTYSQVRCIANDVTDTTEDGSLTILTTSAGTLAERMRIDSSGDLLVAKTSEGLSNDGVELRTTGQILATSTGDAGLFYRKTSVSGAGVILTYSDVGGTESLVGVGYANGTFGVFSDINKKKNIENARNYLDDLMQIRVVKYNWKTDEDDAPKELGWIAQEVAEVFPMMVSEIDGNVLLKKEVFLPMMLKSIQELKADNDALRSTVADLTARLEALENA